METDGKRMKRTRSVLTCVLAATLLASIAAPASALPALPPDGGNPGLQWTATADAPPTHPGVAIEWDVPITMSDGTVLKANVYRPADHSGTPIAEPTPVVLNMTPYTKLVGAIASQVIDTPGVSEILDMLARALNLGGTPLSGLGDMLSAIPGGALRSFAVDGDLVRNGYTQVVVDVRGTGFSQGVWNVLGEREQLDTVETVDWVSHQPWSNGNVGMSGISYSAINQVQAASANPPALKAILPVESGGDLLRDIIAPGGGVGIGFLLPWLTAVNVLKLVPDVQSLAHGTFDQQWLRSRLERPAVFFDLLMAALVTETVDTVPPGLEELLTEDSSIRTDLMARPENIAVPTMLYGGWHDIFTNSQPRMYNAIPLPPGHKQLIMGDTYHLNPAAQFGTPGAPPRLDVLQRAWFDRWLKGIDNGIDNYGPVTVKQQGGPWASLPSFPRPGMTYQRMYLDPEPSGTSPHSVHDGSLRTDTHSGGTLTLAPGLATLCSQDSAQGLAGITALLDACGKDSRIAEHAALTFTSAPVGAATQISGPVNVHLETMLDTTDGYWTATLNDVAPDGTSTALTSGQLAASLRKTDDARSTRLPSGDYVDPFHLLTLDDRLPTVPGQITTLDVGLTATDAVLQPGHRLRVDIFAGNFPKGLLPRPLLNESQLAPQHLVLDPQRPSFVTVPTDIPLA